MIESEQSSPAKSLLLKWVEGKECDLRISSLVHKCVCLCIGSIEVLLSYRDSILCIVSIL